MIRCWFWVCVSIIWVVRCRVWVTRTVFRWARFVFFVSLLWRVLVNGMVLVFVLCLRWVKLILVSCVVVIWVFIVNLGSVWGKTEISSVTVLFCVILWTIVRIIRCLDSSRVFITCSVVRCFMVLDRVLLSLRIISIFCCVFRCWLRIWR